MPASDFPELGREAARELANTLASDPDAAVRASAEATLLNPLTDYERRCFRLLESESAYLLEVCDATQSGVYWLLGAWHAYQRWTARPSGAELAQTKELALHDARFFGRCEVCAERKARGHLQTRKQQAAPSYCAPASSTILESRER